MDSRLFTCRERGDASFETVEGSFFGSYSLLDCRFSHLDYAMRQPEQIASEGTFRWGAKGPRSLAEDRSIPFGGKISPTLHGYPEQELTVIPYLELQKVENVTNHRIDEPYVCDQAIQLVANEFKILDFGTNLVGFF